MFMMNTFKYLDMEKSYLCRCNNCGAIMIDENPSRKSVLLPVLPEIVCEMSTFMDKLDSSLYFGCHKCKKDDYLIDVTYISDDPKIGLCISDEFKFIWTNIAYEFGSALIGAKANDDINPDIIDSMIEEYALEFFVIHSHDCIAKFPSYDLRESLSNFISEKIAQCKKELRL